MSFMESTVRLDDNPWDLLDITSEWSTKFYEFATSWSYSTVRSDQDEEEEEYLKIYFIADKK